MGPKASQYLAEFECIIILADGTPCGCKRKIYHKKGKAVQTSNLIEHLRARAARCPLHKKALEGESKNYVVVDGEQVKIQSFSEAFR